MVALPETGTRSVREVDRGRRRDDEEGEDEEEETWAALERLPTQERIRTTIVEREEDGRRVHRTVPVEDVDLPEYLTTKIFKLNNPQEDNQNFLSRLRDRLDQAGVEVPSVEVRYENVKVEGQVYVGRRALPTLVNTVLNFAETIVALLGVSRLQKRKLTILEGLSGSIKPGRMTLLLGPPSSGKSSFLRCLAGTLDSSLKLEGTITYNGYHLDEFEPKKTAAYINQEDLHMAELTVRETMAYSARYQGVSTRFDLITELVRREKEQGITPDPETDYFFKASAMEKISHELLTEYYMKMIVGPARTLFMDEISTGLDSSTAFQVVKCIGQVARIFKATIVISLLQPAPEAYELFDDVILLSGGRIVYHGPLAHVREFFESCGFKCPPRKTIPDFLQEVTSVKDQEQYWADKSTPYKFVPVVHFVEAYKNFHLGQKMYQELSTPSEKSAAGLAFDHWSLPQWDLFKITLEKEILIFKRNWPIPVLNMMMLLLNSALGASLFFRTEMHRRNMADAQHYSGALFQIINLLVFRGYSEVTFTAIRFPVFNRLREAQFFPPWTWAVSSFIIRIPSAIIESLACLSVTYYVIGFAPAASRFFKLWFILALSNQMASGLFRMIAGFCRTFVIATSVGGFFLVLLFILGGYAVPRTTIRKWWIWGYWAFPLSYIENAVLVNEYLAPGWRKVLPNDRHTLGHRFMLSVGLFDRGYWYWMVCGLLVAYIVSFYICFGLAITYLGSPYKTPSQITETQLAEQDAQRNGGRQDPEKKPKSMPHSISSTLKSSSSGGLTTLSSTGPGQKQKSSPLVMKDDSSKSGGSPEDGSEIQTAAGVGTSSRSLHSTCNTSSNNNSSGESSDSNKAAGKNRRTTGMSLPFQPLSISFKNVDYFVDMPMVCFSEL